MIHQMILIRHKQSTYKNNELTELRNITVDIVSKKLRHGSKQSHLQQFDT